jgi:hypothetical protein
VFISIISYSFCKQVSVERKGVLYNYERRCALLQEDRVTVHTGNKLCALFGEYENDR